MEKIIKIEETAFKRDAKDYETFIGFLIATDKQIIKLGVSDGQSCCENYGYFMSEDNPKEFEGAKLKNITVTDTALKTHLLEQNNLMYDGTLSLDEGGIMFINLETTKGTLQFVAYNSHNGYYGHTGIVISEQLKKEESL